MIFYACYINIVPYVSRISGGLKAGKAIFIQGSVPSGCESFVVNLKCGESKGNDIAFQIRTQFSSNCMVLNSRQHGAWGKKEKLELPLKQGSSFDLIIAVNSENYQVYVNGKELYIFKHRIPLEKVSTLNISGHVVVSLFGFISAWEPTVCSHPRNLPYVAPISGGLREGMALYLKGVIPTNAERDDTAFHFNPRLHQKVVMNSFRNRKWEAKESSLHDPKRKLGACPHTGCVALVYQVYVNGKELYTFKHRIPLEKVSTLNISGHVVVSLFGFMQVSYIFYSC
uniref:Galectin n=1 Tax=Cyprinus carpio TaxID=7962 RepID=A0A8C2KDF1_CYPCA